MTWVPPAKAMVRNPLRAESQKGCVNTITHATADSLRNCAYLCACACPISADEIGPKRRKSVSAGVELFRGRSMNRYTDVLLF